MPTRTWGLVRALRIQIPGAWYHVLSRGNARQHVFLEPADFARFQDLLGETCVRFEWQCPTHCLMPNHYHLLVRTEHPNLSAGMRHLNGVFTQRYNTAHARVGHVFQGRFKALLIQDERYLVTLMRYIIVNPVKAGLVEHPRAWPWGAYRWVTGAVTAPGWASPEPLWRKLAIGRDDAPRTIDALLGQPSDDPLRVSRDGVLGGERSRRRLRGSLEGKRTDRTHSRSARFADRPSLATLLAEPDGVWRALTEWGYSQRDIAHATGLSEATISRRVAIARRERKRT